ncbi:MAG: hypothetical protein SAJ12_24060 [Jaaginema sp. PMC 1079.18]|nr:hypothetical protein [Jaaginema sp. PMC 1079.18]
MKLIALGQYLTLDDFCLCSETYQKYAQNINPYPQQPETITALKDLNQHIIDPIIQRFGRDNFQLTYGFCSPDLKRFLNQKDPETGIKNGRIDPSRDQHLCYELNRNHKPFCDRGGAACDFLIQNRESDRVVTWIVESKLPFDSLYFYGKTRPIHISYGLQHKRDIWTFNSTGQPTRKGTEIWQNQIKST